MPTSFPPADQPPLTPEERSVAAPLSHQAGSVQNGADVDSAAQRFMARLEAHGQGAGESRLLTHSRPSMPERYRGGDVAGGFRKRFGGQVLRPYERNWIATNVWRSWTIVSGLAALAIAGIAGEALLAKHHVRRTAALPRGYVTAAGQTEKVTLPDGSEVVLAPQSQLIVAQDFGENTRAVVLTGEAYFSVPSAVGTPFIVRTRQVTMQVLGTAFDVRYYAADPVVRVAVVTGRVVMRNHRTVSTLRAGMVAQMTDSTATTNASERVSTYTDWTTGHLVFENEPVSAVLTSVGRWYGYTFRVPDSALATRRIFTSFDVNDRSETLRLIGHLLNVTLTFDGATITLHHRHARDGGEAGHDVAPFLSIPPEAGK